jgi:hypothetical protein
MDERDANILLTPDANHYFAVPVGTDLGAGTFVVIQIDSQTRHVNYLSIAPYEITKQQARDILRGQIEKELGISLDDTLNEVAQYVQALDGLSEPEVRTSAAVALRSLADAIEDENAPLGRRIDALVERLECELGPRMGHDRERETERRQADYIESARSAIADSLRAAGITPLNAPRSSAEPSAHPTE